MTRTTAQLCPEIVTLNHRQQLALHARDLGAFLEVPSLGDHWLRALIAEYGFIEGLDYITSTIEIHDTNTRTMARNTSRDVFLAPGRKPRKTDYYLSLPMAYAIAILNKTVLAQHAAHHILELIEQTQQPALHVELIQDELWKARKDWQRIYRLLKTGLSVEAIAKRMKRSRHSIEGSIDKMRRTCLLVEDH